jgi:2-C-methyl-D-erythritol 4-phosphate cytidylyltransferase
LRAALESAIAEGAEITDEASAMEYSGARPRLVPGHADNIKVTVPADLALAELFLREQEREPR